MKTTVKAPPGRATTAADLTIAVCLALDHNPIPGINPRDSPPKTRPRSRNGSATPSARTISRSITASMVATPHRSLVRMHLLLASRG